MMLFATLALFGCDSETAVRALEPDWVVSPETVEFGKVVVDYTTTFAVEVLNTGEIEIDISQITLADGTVFSVPQESILLEVDERATIEVTFTPPNYLDYSDVLTLGSTDQRLEDLEIPITGVGGDGPTPDIHVDPIAIDFGDVDSGSVAIEFFTVENKGDGPLFISATTQTGAGVFEIVGDPDGYTLDGDTVANVAVTYSPTSTAGDYGSFTIASNDPDEPVVEVTLLGNNGGEYQYPVAVINGPDQVDPPELVSLDGSDSYDPNGGAIVSYRWSLSKLPEGSQSELNAEAADASNFQVDVAGTYWVELQVTNEAGVASAPTKQVIEAVPEDLIHIELVWDTNNSDLDLHLLEGSGAQFYLIPGDCCYCNPSPNWGDFFESTDNCRLDLDDRFGFGPENINIDIPSEGEFFTQVYYFTDNGGGPTNATVRFYIDGKLDRTFTKLMNQTELWQVAYIRTPDNVVVEQELDLTTTDDRDCRLGVQ
jgi:hypothetical protein